jgi:hypothetical protein
LRQEDEEFQESLGIQNETLSQKGKNPILFIYSKQILLVSKEGLVFIWLPRPLVGTNSQVSQEQQSIKRIELYYADEEPEPPEGQ